MIPRKWYGFIRHNSSSTITNFLTHNTIKSKKATLIPPQSIPSASYAKPDDPSLKCHFENHSQFISEVYGRHYRPHFTRPNTFPRLPLDIKGLGNNAHLVLLRSMILKNTSSIKSQFFLLKFFPANHAASAARKSNVAFSYLFTNNKVLGSVSLENSVKQYKGQWRTLPFFHAKTVPFKSSFQRSIFKKRVKQALFNSIDKLVKHHEISRVLGVFFFYLNDPPKVKEEVGELQRQMDNAVLKILRSDYTTTYSVNQQRSLDLNTQGYEFTQTLGYYPKLPFMRKGNKRIR